MKIICKTKSLLTAASFCASLSKTRSTLAALSHIKLNAQAGWLELFGSNLEIFKTHRCEAQIKDGKESFGLPANLFVSFLRSAPGEDIELTYTKDTCTVTSGSVKATFATLLAEEFPAIPEPEETGTGPFAVSAEELQKKLKQSAHAAHTNKDAFLSRCAVWAQFFDNGLHLTAFDGKRLATAKIDAKGKGSYILPTDLVNEVASVDEPGTVMVSFSQNYATFTGADWGIQGKLVDDELPDWRRLFDNYKVAATAEAKRDDLIAALRRILLFVPITNINNQTRAEFGKDSLTLSIQNMNGLVEKVPATGPDMAMNINPEHLLKVLSFIESDTVKIGLTDHLSPLQISEGDFTSLTMPYLTK